MGRRLGPCPGRLWEKGARVCTDACVHACTYVDVHVRVCMAFQYQESKWVQSTCCITRPRPLQPLR